jgi:predicted nucleic acid-binding protein
MAGEVVVPPAVVNELAAGRQAGFQLPAVESFGWITVRTPRSAAAQRLAADLGPGETEVLMLALETPGAVAVLDDGLGRRVAEGIGVRFTGTLGILLAAKRSGRILSVRPILEQLQGLGFRVSPRTRDVVLKRAGEAM